MFQLSLTVLAAVILGARLGCFGQCPSGTCPLTSIWWRGAPYGTALGFIVANNDRAI